MRQSLLLIRSNFHLTCWFVAVPYTWIYVFHPHPQACHRYITSLRAGDPVLATYSGRSFRENAEPRGYSFNSGLERSGSNSQTWREWK